LAVYEIQSPGKIWDAQDNGAYTLSVQAGQVADDGGPANYVVAGSLGGLTVSLTDRSIYVSPTGLTTNNGTQSSPFPSVAYALSVVGGGETIILEPGTYAPILVPRGCGGTSAYPTVIQSQVKWQAVIDGTLNPAAEGLSSESPWSGDPTNPADSTNYVTFDGLKVENAGSFGINLGGDWNVAENCWVIGCKHTGIGVFGHNYTVVQDNLVEHDGTDPSLDHGIYAGGTGLVVIGNVVRYNSGGGIQMDHNPVNCTISGNLVYGQKTEPDMLFSGDLLNAANTVTNNILLDDRAGAILAYGPNSFGVWSGNQVDPAVSASSLNSITSNNVADYSRALSLILPVQSAAQDRTAPTAIVSDGGAYVNWQMVMVTYSDNQSLAWSKISPSNVIIKGPGGYSAAAQSVSIMEMTPNGRTLEVMYYLTPPKGGWTSANNGKYSVYLQANQIGDLAGNYASSGAISGGFNLTFANAPQSALKDAFVHAGTVTAPATQAAYSVPVQGFSGGAKVSAVTASPAAPPSAVSQASSKTVFGSFAGTTNDSAFAATEIMDLLPTLPPLQLPSIAAA
jgi:hypothetical protein